MKKTFRFTYNSLGFLLLLFTVMTACGSQGAISQPDSSEALRPLPSTDNERYFEIGKVISVEEFLREKQEIFEINDTEEENAGIKEIIEQLGLTKSDKYSHFYGRLESYQNPIDSVYLELLQGDGYSCEAERRLYQDSYGAAWRKEFYHAAELFYEALTFEEDKQIIVEYVKTTENYIGGCVQAMLLCDLDECNQTMPGERDISWGIMGGNGSRSWLNEEMGYLYREAALRLIEQYEGGGVREYEYLTNCFEPAEGIGTQVPEMFQ